MAVSSVVPRVQYTATSGQTVFTVPWKWFADGDIKAYLTPVGNEPYAPEDIIVLNVDYILTGVGVDAGGTLTLVTPATLNDIITIERDSIGDRPETYDFEVSGTFTVEQLNKNFDKLSMATQDNNMLINNRMLVYGATENLEDADLTLPKLENGYIWKKNDNGVLIAAKLEEDVDVTTLRSELASQAPAAPGTSIIGHYDSDPSISGVVLEDYLHDLQDSVDDLEDFRTDLASQAQTNPGTDLIGYYDLNDSTGKTLTEFLNNVDESLRDDLADQTEANAGTKLIGHYDEEYATGYTLYDYMQEYVGPAGSTNRMLLHFEGDNGSRIIEDQYRKSSVTCVGVAAISTTQAKWGSSSMFVNGGSLIINGDSLEPGSSDFSIDMWLYPTVESRQAIYAEYSTDFWVGIDYHYNGTRNVNLWASNNGTGWSILNGDPGGNAIGSISLTLNSWNHVAFIRSGTTWVSYINGTKDVEVTADEGVFPKSANKALGKWGGGGGVNNWTGYIDEVRVVIGDNPWFTGSAPATITVPTGPYA